MMNPLVADCNLRITGEAQMFMTFIFKKILPSCMRIYFIIKLFLFPAEAL